jgi:predicted SAM-dependent methyltransferase
MIKLNIGCGILLIPGYINVDSMFSLEDLKNGAGVKGNLYESAVVPEGVEFVQSDILHMPFEDNYADLVEAHQTVEHFGMREVIPAFNEIYRVLKPGGKFILTTPNFNNLVLQWINMLYRHRDVTGFDINDWVSNAEVFYGNQATAGEFHRCPMTPEFLKYCLSQSGFTGCEGKMIIFPVNSLMPKEGFGLMSQIVRDHSIEHFFRTETIYLEVTKK